MLMTILVLAGALSGAADRQQDASRTSFPFFEPVRPRRMVQVMSHRGAMRQAPENTAPALERSIADGGEWIEVDVRLTRDGQHVLFHDDQVGNKTDGSGLVRDHSLEEIRKLDAGARFARRFAGARILSLDEGLALARGRVNLYLDCKDVDPEKLAREVVASGMERQVVIYGKTELLGAVRKAATAELALMAKWRPALSIAGWVERNHPAAVEVDAADVTLEASREFHLRGIKVQAKTLGADDCAATWERMAASGVDWIQTDLAEEVIAWEARTAIRSRQIKIAHHRGSSRYAPENTLPALEEAVRLGADFVEFDVRTTRDGGFVLMHDRGLARTTPTQGLVRDWDEARVRALDAGSWFGLPFQGTRVPSLDEFLKAAGQRVELYVDAKDIAPAALAEALKRHGLTERAVVYQQIDYLERLSAIAPAIRRMPPLRDPDLLDAVAQRVRPFAVDCAWSILSKALIDRCHAREIQVFSDALGAHETIEEYQRAIRNRVDVIQTDHPLRVLRAIELCEQQNWIEPAALPSSKR
jgi:glycerophosphoryl diester phosphodiesterase